MRCNGCFKNKNCFYPHVSISQCQKSLDYRNPRWEKSPMIANLSDIISSTKLFFSQQLSLKRWFLSPDRFYIRPFFFSQSPTFFSIAHFFFSIAHKFTVRWISLMSVSKWWFSDLSYCQQTVSRICDKAKWLSSDRSGQGVWGKIAVGGLSSPNPSALDAIKLAKTPEVACFPLRGKMPGYGYTTFL